MALLRALGWVVLCGAAAGCFFDPTEVHPVLKGSPASEEDSNEARATTVLATARKDLTCAAVAIVLDFPREYANSAQPRFVVQGCGVRALYAEDCREAPRCRYLLLSVLTLGGPAVGPTP
jgi:hypothetical protein